jgi:hypothetical protein
LFLHDGWWNRFLGFAIEQENQTDGQERQPRDPPAECPVEPTRPGWFLFGKSAFRWRALGINIDENG